MPNIQFNYLYRDSGNYKKYDFVIFANPDNIGLKEFEKLILDRLIDNQWFYANEWGLPELFFDWVDFRIDPTWHEFESIEFSDEPANYSLIIEDVKRSKGELSESHKDELNRRLTRLENGETAFFTWEEIQKEILERSGNYKPPQHPHRHLFLPHQKNNHKGFHPKEVAL